MYHTEALRKALQKRFDLPVVFSWEVTPPNRVFIDFAITKGLFTVDRRMIEAWNDRNSARKFILGYTGLFTIHAEGTQSDLIETVGVYSRKLAISEGMPLFVKFPGDLQVTPPDKTTETGGAITAVKISLPAMFFDYSGKATLLYEVAQDTNGFTCVFRRTDGVKVAEARTANAGETAEINSVFHAEADIHNRVDDWGISGTVQIDATGSGTVEFEQRKQARDLTGGEMAVFLTVEDGDFIATTDEEKGKNAVVIEHRAKATVYFYDGLAEE